MRKLIVGICVLLTVLIVLPCGQAGVYAQTDKNADPGAKAAAAVSERPSSGVKRARKAGKREMVEFVALDETDPRSKKMTVKNGKGELVQIELPSHILVRKAVPVSDLKKDEKIMINYRTEGDRNIAVFILSGEMITKNAQVSTGKKDKKSPAPGKTSWLDKIKNRFKK